MTAKTHVLLIDDDQGTMELLKEVLQKEGYAIDEANTGQKALAQARTFPFDVVLDDLRLPDVDGIEVLRTLHALDSDLPVIVMTAFGSMETEHHRADRGDRHRQGTHRPRRPFQQPETECALRRRGLRGAPREPPRERAVRA